MNRHHSRRLKIAAAVLLACLLGACQTSPSKIPDGSPTPYGKKLDGMLNKVRAAPPANADGAVRPATLNGESISVDFAGSAEDLLRQMSATRRDTFRIEGPSVRLPVFVHIDLAGVSYRAFLREVGAALGQRADLVIQSDRSYVLRYRDLNAFQGIHQGAGLGGVTPGAQLPDPRSK